MNEKDQIRKAYNKKRAELSAEEVSVKSAEILERLFLLLAPYKTIHIFLPIPKNNEIDTWPLLDFADKYDKSLCTSIVKGDDLDHVYIDKNTTFEYNSWGIPIPDSNSRVPISEIDVILTPLLAYDAMGNRVGYGKGYYDKFFAACEPHTLKVGLSFFKPCEDFIRMESHDVRLNKLVHPSDILSFDC